VVPSLDVLAMAALETLKVSLPTVVQAARGTLTTRVCNERLDSWSRNLVRQAGIRIEVSGREHIVRDEPFVVLSNHQSHYDIPVLFQALGVPLRMVAKKELFRIPFMSGAMRAAGFVELDRKNREKAIRTLASARSLLDGAICVWMAPEGTRSSDGRLGEFKKGGFHLALQAGMRILPVTIDGTRFVLPKGAITVTRGISARVTIETPIDPKEFGNRGMRELVNVVRGRIERNLPPELQGAATSNA
jgi:1-acyl-sn-glycerol-3-phosphate acyltransferase